DGDGHGAQDTLQACDAPLGYAALGDDCDDRAADISPSAVEVWYDGVDQDCDEADDYDQDGDGSQAYASGGVDCDDLDPLSLGDCGGSPDTAVVDCQEASDIVPGATNGLFWIDPDSDSSTAPFQAYCDVESSAEAWTLIMRLVNANFEYEDPLWTTEALVSEDVYALDVDGGSKYPAFNAVPFTVLRSSTLDLSDAFTEDLGTEYPSALALFQDSGAELGTLPVPYWNSIVQDFSKSWGCTTYNSYGVNQKDYLGVAFISGGALCDWNGGARWGQRVNAYHGGTGNHAGQGWGMYSTISTGDAYRGISQLLWVR
ncbi:MAG: hypothetical protein JXX28_01650, partial [Deltaproteobacteria bacterium]|nr:hypothetical protein [Deltaproteobacteria bacterium]